MLSSSHYNLFARAPQRRLLTTVSIILFLSVLLLRQQSPTRITAQVPVNKAHHSKLPYHEELGVSLGISEWGKRGQSTKKMIQWAEALIGHSDDVDETDKALFQAALTHLFPFLAGTEKKLYTPWTSSTNEPPSNGVGIVICAGSNNIHLATHLIRNLRRVHGSKLPIEIAYAGEKDLHSKHRNFLAREDVSFNNLLEFFPAARQDLKNSGWAMKPFALLASSHTRAILIDADAIFLAAPDDIFESNAGLNRTGLLLFHDRASEGRGGESLKFLKSQIEAANRTVSSYLQNQSLFYRGVTSYEADSGAVAIDKSRPSLLLGLIFATWMNKKQVREEVTYKLYHGDKETYWIAMELANVEYFFQPWYAGSIGNIGQQSTDYDSATTDIIICGKHMLHLDSLGQKPFWFNGGIYDNKDSPEQGFGAMTHFWTGIKDAPPQWYWVPQGFACVKEKNINLLSEQDKKNLDLTRQQVLEIDAEIKAL
ncbi:hypothetical protein BT63DRAFT_50522 [Microthyrium microscopicum]|uniref:Nucleotide-diphospho-sugar transferase n=1 Tax=Microthyrium microscopicum TaxID=703497 RepID=A0A6A6U1F8_9PEZI|nr:hypothetical protein BT63DRAFT_50522 [Microthyrium microscopicum]